MSLHFTYLSIHPSIYLSIYHRGLTSGRSDDNIITARKRFATFKAETMPIIQHFNQTKMSYDLIIIDGNRDVQVVYNQIRQVFISLIEKDIINITKTLNRCINSQRWSDYNIYCNTNSINADMEIQVNMMMMMMMMMISLADEYR